MKSFNGRVAAITGAASGMGRDPEPVGGVDS